MADLFDIAVAKKLSGGGGGGGGDLSKATVTLVDSDGIGAVIKGAFCIDTAGTSSPSDDCTFPMCFTDEFESVGIALYKGTAVIDAGGILDEGATFAVSGSATADGFYIIVTGDCTITVAAG